jgi:ABC-type sugar transport system permease subunit
VACTVVLLAVVVIESFQVAPPGQPAQYGLDSWRAAFAEPLLRAALVNTLKATVARQVISLALAILIAWLIARTDLPGRNLIEFGFWAAFFLPTLTVTLSWILLLDPDYGLVNPALIGLGLGARAVWGPRETPATSRSCRPAPIARCRSCCSTSSPSASSRGHGRRLHHHGDLADGGLGRPRARAARRAGLAADPS